MTTKYQSVRKYLSTSTLYLGLWLSLPLPTVAQNSSTMGDCSPIISGSNNKITCPNSDTVSALINADFDYIRGIAQKNDIWKIEAALSNKLVAQTFLATLKLARKNDFLLELLKYKLSPNLIVTNGDGYSEALLVAAFKAKNSEAMIILLRNGASPHAYEDIAMSTEAKPFFVYPHLQVQNASFFDESEKTEITKALIQYGLMIYDPGPNKSYGEKHQRVNEVVEKIAHNLKESIKIKDGQCPKSATSICKNTPNPASYCNFSSKIPAKIKSKKEERDYSDFNDIEIKGFAGLYNKKAYYLSVAPGWDGSTVLLEYSADMNHILLKKYIGPGAGMGFCRDTDKLSRYEQCWRSVQINIYENKVMLNNFYDYDFEFCENK